jgi:hypothetical protein
MWMKGTWTLLTSGQGQTLFFFALQLFFSRGDALKLLCFRLTRDPMQEVEFGSGEESARLRAVCPNISCKEMAVFLASRLSFAVAAPVAVASDPDPVTCPLGK